ncbi:pathogen-associated molecular patterns-induced protein A70 [Solanum lycopersicum]|uniref:pathogen-associated molecular patterns-induced protein A70 n=1 Tax=Solanum lycopersicum TaxID=4081 RepID=UPI0037489E9C
MIECLASWLTPIILFCLLNLMIGTIFITSNLKTHKNTVTTTTPSRVKSFNFCFPDPFPSHNSQLDPTSSLLQRVKSINLSFSRPDQIPLYDDEIEPQIEVSHVTRSKSATCTEEKVQTRTILVKSASEKKMPEVDLRRPATTRETVRDDEAVDKKADDFINKFRQQLKLQRLHSILRYKQMLNRGDPSN